MGAQQADSMAHDAAEKKTMMEGLQDCPDWESRRSRQFIMGIKQIKKITVKTKGGHHVES